MAYTNERRQLIEKYADTLAEMSEHEIGDMNVLFDKLVYMARKTTDDGDVYFVPDGFDFDAFNEDLKKLG